MAALNAAPPPPPASSAPPLLALRAALPPRCRRASAAAPDLPEAGLGGTGHVAGPYNPSRPWEISAPRRAALPPPLAVRRRASPLAVGAPPPRVRLFRMGLWALCLWPPAPFLT